MGNSSKTFTRHQSSVCFLYFTTEYLEVRSLSRPLEALIMNPDGWRSAPPRAASQFAAPFFATLVGGSRWR